MYTKLEGDAEEETIKMACSASDTEPELSPQQEAALEEFRSEVSCISNKPEDNDRYYLRWLKARNYNVQKAVQMFKNVSS